VNCREFEQFLDSYLDGDLQGTLKLEFEAHLVDCECCGHEFAMMEAVGRIISSPGPDEPRLSSDFTDRVMVGLSSEKEKTLHFRRTAGRIIRAAVIVLVSAGTVMFAVGRGAKNASLRPQAERGAVMMAMNTRSTEEQELNLWLAKTLERAGTNLWELKELKSSAFDQVRQGLFTSLAGPTPAVAEPEPVKPVMEKSSERTPLPVQGSRSDPGLELL
jgi:hypothetical protein